MKAGKIKLAYDKLLISIRGLERRKLDLELFAAGITKAYVYSSVSIHFVVNSRIEKKTKPSQEEYVA